MGVASLQEGDFTTCCSFFPEMSIVPLKKNNKIRLFSFPRNVDHTLKKRITKLGINILIVFFFYKYAQNMMMKNNARMTLFNFISSPSENYYTERNVSEHL